MNIVKVYHFPVQNTYTGKLLFSSFCQKYGQPIRFQFSLINGVFRRNREIIWISCKQIDIQYRKKMIFFFKMDSFRYSRICTKLFWLLGSRPPSRKMENKTTSWYGCSTILLFNKKYPDKLVAGVREW